MRLKILVLGASGMLGHVVFTNLSSEKNYSVLGTVRSNKSPAFIRESIVKNIILNCDVLDNDGLIDLFSKFRPDVVINCVGIIKQIEFSNDPIVVLPINSIFPHKLAKLCHLFTARLIHISTDCVFSGHKGEYVEDDVSDALDLYGKSKFIGEVDKNNCLTLRTSVVGHEIQSANGLVNWFLSQKTRVKGFSRAFFSGLTTNEFARVIKDHVIKRNDMSGIYHVGGSRISKFDLLCIIRDVYNIDIEIYEHDQFITDRSLNSTKFYKTTGYQAPAWKFMISDMYEGQHERYDI